MFAGDAPRNSIQSTVILFAADVIQRKYVKSSALGHARGRGKKQLIFNNFQKVEAGWKKW